MNYFSNSTFDSLLIGQGLAGSVLALKLIWEGKKIIVIDQPSLSSSSRIAPGIFNPVVFKRLALSWNAENALRTSEIFYKQAESFLNESFYHKKQIVKLFTEEQEKILWRKKAEGNENPFLSKEVFPAPFSAVLNNEGGYAFVNGSGNLEAGKFLNAVKNYLLANDAFREEIFDYGRIQLNPDNTVTYKTYTANKIIFCEGYRVIHNPYFNWLPMKLVKGEVLTVQIPGLNLEEKIISKGISILPCGGDVYKVGSTFDWEDLSETITKKANKSLTEKLKMIIRLPFTVIGHHAGVRPSVKHRRPLLGLHPEHSQLAVFNGLGTKGVMLAPMCAREMVKLLNGETIGEEFKLPLI